MLSLRLNSKHNFMERQNTIAIILLNILFCVALLWFFSRNAIIRPYLGSPAKEVLSGLLLLATMYANYSILYPKLYPSRTRLYWLLVVISCLVTGSVELVIGFSCIMKCSTSLINDYGLFFYFSNDLLFVFSRNFAFNLFTYMLRVQKQMQQSLEKEVQIVYQYA